MFARWLSFTGTDPRAESALALEKPREKYFRG